MKTKWGKFKNRKEHIDDALEFLNQTEAVDKEYDRQEEVRNLHFEELRRALNSRKINIVVVGEFSRGKSMLLNALMGLDLLPTAVSQTTAVNAFIQGIPNGKSPYVKILFQDGRCEELPFETHVIEKWGTELDKAHRDVRMEIDKIEVYTDHSLFQNDVILIDTPGLKGVLPHHEAIARQAMNESHVAIWLQSADQLGGSASEWNFLAESLVRDFNKFITIVNKWDLIHDEAEKIAKKESLSEQDIAGYIRKHIEYNLNQVRDNFREYSKLPEDKLTLLTDEKHLMGVSAMWALSNDLDKREKSNIQTLADRIQEMCTTGEAHKEILVKPLTVFLEIQRKIKANIEAEWGELQNPKDLEELGSESEKVAFEIQKLEQERAAAESDSNREHRHYAVKFAYDIQQELVMPLKELKNQLEIYISEEYIRRQIDQGVKTITLPEEVREEYEDVTEKISENWNSTRGSVLNTLRDLREGFAEHMKGTGQRLSEVFQNTDFNLPELDVNLDIDLGAIESYQIKKQQLETEYQELEEQIEEMQKEKAVDEIGKKELERKLKELEQQRDFIKRQHENLGPQPNPIRRSEQTVEKGIWKDKPSTIETIDDSNVEAWKAQKEDFENRGRNKDQEIEQIRSKVREEEGREISKVYAQKRFEKDMKKKRRELEKLKEYLDRDASQLKSDILRRMKRATTSRIEKMIGVLERNAARAVEKLFEDQLKALIQCVQEQYTDRLATRKTQLESVEHRIREGQASITRRKNELNALIDRLNILMKDTGDLYSRITI